MGIEAQSSLLLLHDHFNLSIDTVQKILSSEFRLPSERLGVNSSCTTVGVKEATILLGRIDDQYNLFSLAQWNHLRAKVLDDLLGCERRRFVRLAQSAFIKSLPDCLRKFVPHIIAIFTKEIAIATMSYLFCAGHDRIGQLEEKIRLYTGSV